jgi:hypothetical protein
MFYNRFDRNGCGRFRAVQALSVVIFFNYDRTPKCKNNLTKPDYSNKIIIIRQIIDIIYHLVIKLLTGSVVKIEYGGRFQ